MLAPHLGSFASAAALNSAFPPGSVPAGTLAYTADQGTLQSNGAAWIAMGGAQLGLGARSLSLKSANFAATVAQAPLLANYQFGSSVAGGSGIIPIRNQTDLANNFNAFEDFTLFTSINSELQRYQPFNSANHVFNASNLTLQALNPNGDWQCTAIAQMNGLVSMANGTPMSIASLGLPDTSGVQLGQIAAVQGGGGVGGVYMVTAIVTNASVTFSPLQGSTTGSTLPAGLIFFLPIVGVALSAPYVNGGPSFQFASLPAFVQVGMAVAVNASPLTNQVLNRSADTRVTNIAGSVVSISPVGANLPNLGTGTIVWFLPVITSGQIWSQLQIDMTNPQSFFAIEADLTLINSVGTRTAIGTNGALTLAQFNGLPNTTPLGAWPAFWAFSADDGNSAHETSSAAEDDFMEIQIGCTQDCAFLNTGAVTYPGAATIMTKNDSGWTSFAAFGIAIAPSGTNFIGRHLFQQIICNGVAYRFFDGVLYNVRQFQWNNQRPMQFSVGIATGGLTPALAMNTIFPNNPAGFPNIQASVNGIRVWQQLPP